MTLVRRVEGNRRTALTGWQIAAASPGTPREAIDGLEWLPATVPGTAAGALRSAGHWDFSQTRDFDAEDFWWRCRFRTDPGNAVLGFDGLATLADVWLDGELVLTSENMFRGHEVPVILRGEHELLVRCRALAPELARRRRPRPRWRVPMLEQQQLRWFRTTLLGRTPGWSPPCPAVGPWRPVWLETRAVSKSDPSGLTHADDWRPWARFRSRPRLDAARRWARTLVVERDGQRVRRAAHAARWALARLRESRTPRAVVAAHAWRARVVPVHRWYWTVPATPPASTSAISAFAPSNSTAATETISESLSTAYPSSAGERAGRHSIP